MAATEAPTTMVTDENGEVESPEQTQQRAMRQIEFYLSDSNLPYDRFMWGLYDKTNAHWISIKQLASFNRMKQFQDHGHDWLLDALRTSQVLEVDEKGENVRRILPLTERPYETVEARSVYAKGFPDEYPSLQVELERYFSRFGAINAVRMRRKDDKAFKNSVFCEFSETESAKRFLETEEGTKEFKGKELVVMSKADYIKMKCDEKGISPDTKPTKESSGQRKFNAFRQMKKEGRTDSDPRPESGSLDVTKTFSILGQDLTIEPTSDGKWRLKDESELQYVPGAIAAFECEGNVKMGAIKAGIRSALDLSSYIINPPGENTGVVVFPRALSEEEFKKLESTRDAIDGGVYAWKRVPEEEERNFQREHVISSIERRADEDDTYSNTRGRGGRSNRGGGRGGRGGRDGGRGGRGASRGGRGGDRNREKESNKAELKVEESNKEGLKVETNIEKKENSTGPSPSPMDVDPKSPAKRKREEAEPDGPEGERGGEPVAVKKARVD